MLLTKCEICGRILSENELQGYHRRLLLSSDVEDPPPRCFQCVNEVKNLLRG